MGRGGGVGVDLFFFSVFLEKKYRNYFIFFMFIRQKIGYLKGFLMVCLD